MHHRPAEVGQIDYASYARNVYSQCGEDGVIGALLGCIPNRTAGAWNSVPGTEPH